MPGTVWLFQSQVLLPLSLPVLAVSLWCLLCMDSVSVSVLLFFCTSGDLSLLRGLLSFRCGSAWLDGPESLSLFSDDDAGDDDGWWWLDWGLNWGRGQVWTGLERECGLGWATVSIDADGNGEWGAAGCFFCFERLISTPSINSRGPLHLTGFPSCFAGFTWLK